MKIFWTHTAIRQRNKIFNYWDERNGSTTYSDKLKRLIKERLALLKFYPKLGKSAEFEDFRLLPMGAFSIYYSIQEKGIFITAYWDNHQDPDALIEVLRKKKNK